MYEVIYLILQYQNNIIFKLPLTFYYFLGNLKIRKLPNLTTKIQKSC